MKWVGWNIVIFTPLPCDDNCSVIYDVRAEPSSHPKKLMGERLNFYKEALKEKFDLIYLSAEHDALKRKLILTIKSNNILEKDFSEKLRSYLIELAEKAPLQNYKNTNWRRYKKLNLAPSLKQSEIPVKKPRGMSWDEMGKFLKIVPQPPQPTAEISEEIETSDIGNIPEINEYLEAETHTSTQEQAEEKEEIINLEF